MLNYGEELAYWYLRFNGFFIITNYVLHYEQENAISDFDLLAVRFPYETETMDVNTLKHDQKLFDEFDDDTVIGLICEVRISKDRSIESLFDELFLSKALCRFGFVKDYKEYAKELKDQKIITIEDKYQIGKLLIAEGDPNKDGCINISLNSITEFINDRIAQDIRSKYIVRMRFPSSLLQYIIWKEHSINLNY